MGVILTAMGYMQVISLLGGSLLGYLLKFIAIREKAKQDQFNRMMTAIDKADASADKADKRGNDHSPGNWTRRFIVFAILFGVILGPFLLALMHEPTVVMQTIQRPEYFFGLFGGGTKVNFVELQGYLLSEETRTALSAIIGFYFGQSAAKPD